jgi:CheY-like chemotaxis protein
MNAVILDDDSVIRHLLANVLIKKGYEVTSYSSPDKCQIYSKTSCPCTWEGACPDLIVTDFDMPSVNGIEFIKHLEQKKCKCRNIAMISGGHPEHDLKEMLPRGIAFFPKPFRLKTFGVWLDEIRGQYDESVNAENRRRFVRYPCELPVEVSISSCGFHEKMLGVARNISKGGLLLECSKFLAPMTECLVAFTIPEWMSLKKIPDQTMEGDGRDVMMVAQACHSNTNSKVYGLQFLEALA